MNSSLTKQFFGSPSSTYLNAVRSACNSIPSQPIISLVGFFQTVRQI
jgi:hypothetical protein